MGVLFVGVGGKSLPNQTLIPRITAGGDEARSLRFEGTVGFCSEVCRIGGYLDCLCYRALLGRDCPLWIKQVSVEKRGAMIYFFEGAFTGELLGDFL